MSFRCVVLLLVLVARAAAHGDARAENPGELFQRGEQAYRAGRFGEAVDLLTRVYQLDPRPVILYNLGRALEGDGRTEEAVSAYEDYLRKETSVQDRGRIESHIQALRRQTAERRQLLLDRSAAEQRLADERVAIEQRQVLERRESRRRRMGLAIGALGFGGAILVGGAITGGLALARNDAADHAANQLATYDLRAEAESLKLATDVLLPIGGVIAATGLVWTIVEAKRR